MFPEITNKYYDIFKELEINIGLMISSYFEIIYLENNLFKAQNNLQEFTKNIKILYKKAKILLMKLLKHSEIRMYLYGKNN